jgi:hypothetical protein
LYVLKNYFDWKTTYIEKIYIGESFTLENWFHWKCYLYWKFAFIEKTTYIEKIFSLKNCLCWKNRFHWKTTFIQFFFHIQNVAFKFFFGTWWKLMYENFPFPLKPLWKWLYNMGYLNQYLIKEVFTYINYLYTKGNYRKVT